MADHWAVGMVDLWALRLELMVEMSVEVLVCVTAATKVAQ